MAREEKQECNLCKELVADIAKETGRYKRDFSEIVKNQTCQTNFTCMPMRRIKQEKEKNVSST